MLIFREKEIPTAHNIQDTCWIFPLPTAQENCFNYLPGPTGLVLRFSLFQLSLFFFLLGLLRWKLIFHRSLFSSNNDAMFSHTLCPKTENYLWFFQTPCSDSCLCSFKHMLPSLFRICFALTYVDKCYPSRLISNIFFSWPTLIFNQSPSKSGGCSKPSYKSPSTYFYSDLKWSSLRGMDKEDVVHSYNGILLSQKKEQNNADEI